MSGQPQINRSMRAILIDWLVEVQESFELNHETLYTAVKMMDIYLSR
jgi:cyclin B